MTDESSEFPGLPLDQPEPYGAREHLSRYSLGDNAFRTLRFAQPKALKPGDILATGDRVLSPPREAGNGGVLVHLSGGPDGQWVRVPGRIPIALLVDDDEEAQALRLRAESE